MMEQMTLRRIPDMVGKKLRDRSRRSGRSMNQTAIELLEEALGVRASEGRKRDLSTFSGAWQEEEYREFERHTSQFENVDAEVWAP